MKTSEIINDINRVYESYDNSVKKEVALKYDIDSKKKDEIINTLYKKVIEIRRQENRKEFTQDDIRAFNRVYSYGTFKKATEAFEGESIEFMNFIRAYYENLWKKYGNSYAGKSYFRTMEVIEKVIYNKKNEDSIKKSEENIDGIFNVLVMLTQAYRNYQNKSLLETEEKNFNIIKKEDPKELRENKDFNKLKFYNFVSSHSDKFENLQKYLDFINEDFQKTFDHNLKAVSERLNKHGLKSGENMTIQVIGEDPKFLELILNTHIGTFNCRSIIAALNSYYMRAHHRFIITKR
ncbi:MAG: hypothetical protein J1F35_05985 [Erysipelotrichales bacterium]|nr:hypothetical protein [Erysipelotrichales bacterium]